MNPHSRARGGFFPTDRHAHMWHVTISHFPMLFQEMSRPTNSKDVLEPLKDKNEKIDYDAYFIKNIIPSIRGKVERINSNIKNKNIQTNKKDTDYNMGMVYLSSLICNSTRKLPCLTLTSSINKSYYYWVTSPVTKLVWKWHLSIHLL